MTVPRVLFLMFVFSSCVAHGAGDNASPCRAIFVASGNRFMPAARLRQHLESRPGFGRSVFVPSEMSGPDVTVRVHDEAFFAQRPKFPIALSVSLNSTGETREVLSDQTNKQSQEKLLEDMDRVLLDYCPPPGFDRKWGSVDPAKGYVPECQDLSKVHAVSLYSRTSSFTEGDIRAAFLRDPRLRKASLQTNLAPDSGTPVTVDHELGSNMWSLGVALEGGGTCRVSAYSVKEEEAPAHLARRFSELITGYQPADFSAPPVEFQVRHFGGFKGVNQDIPLLVAFNEDRMIIKTEGGTVLANVNAAFMLDVSGNDYTPPVIDISEDDEWLPKARVVAFDQWLDKDPTGVTDDYRGALLLGTALTKLASDLTQVTVAGMHGVVNQFHREHFLDIVWLSDGIPQSASFMVRGKDQKKIRQHLEHLLDHSHDHHPARPSMNASK